MLRAAEGILVPMSEKSMEPRELSDSELATREKLTVFTRLMVGAGLLGFLLMSLTGWLLVLALVFQLIAVACAIRSLTLFAKTRASGFAYTVCILFILGMLYLAFGTVVQLIFMDQTNAFAECTRSALTISRQEQCTEQLKDGLLHNLLSGS